MVTLLQLLLKTPRQRRQSQPNQPTGSTQPQHHQPKNNNLPSN